MKFPPVPMVAASPHGWQIRDLLQVLGNTQHACVSFLPLPWRAIWLGLKILELLGIATPFRSDSVISLVRQNPKPDFLLAAQMGYNFREFESSFLGAPSVRLPENIPGSTLELPMKSRASRRVAASAEHGATSV